MMGATTHNQQFHHASQTNVGGFNVDNSSQGQHSQQQMMVTRPRVQSATRTGPGGTSSMMSMLDAPNNSASMLSNLRAPTGQRPTKSAANKYRQMMPGNGAIAEEIDYEGWGQAENIMIGGFIHKPSAPGLQNNPNNLMISEMDVESVHYHPSGLQLHKNERKSAVRLKKKDDGGIQTGSQQLMHKTSHNISHGAGVLLGNNFLSQYGQKERQATATMRSQ